MPARVEVFGVRHHGPGSARRLVEALDALAPRAVLIEGPADLTDLLPLAADPAMRPPVALLAYPKDDPGRAVFWPFAVFSPEYRAAIWAARNDAELRFIDLPSTWLFAESAEEAGSGAEDEGGDAGVALDPIARDPIGALAQAAGYEDGESWWRDVIEENPAPGAVFQALEDAMRALRAEAAPPSGREAAREAHMRLEIAKAQRSVDGPIAVVCGAWHVPALREKHAAKDDRALIKGKPKLKTIATWAPWTAPRLASASGYGAGVAAPAWCLHLHEHGDDRSGARWFARIANLLRRGGHLVSTASLIEAERLATSLAALRDKARPGFEEAREAAIACFCFGNSALFETIATELLIGGEVGAVPEGAPTAPLLEDLQRQQRAAKLKPEALARELALDLRSESGLFRSTLLHRLSALGVPWGERQDAGASRGTFRERWVIAWKPEFAVELVEQSIHGASIERAAAGALQKRMAQENGLGALADLVFAAVTAQLPDAAAMGVARLRDRAGLAADCDELLRALPSLSELLRYGGARAIDAAQLEALFHHVAIAGALALPYAARGLDAEATASLRRVVIAADRAIALIDEEGALDAPLRRALDALVSDPSASPALAGLAARIAYERSWRDVDETARLLGRALSRGAPAGDGADYFEGFFSGASARMIHDAALRRAVDQWLCALEEDDFTASLPLFRRVFSTLDPSERRHLQDALFGGARRGGGLERAPDAAARWARRMDLTLRLLEGRADER